MLKKYFWTFLIRFWYENSDTFTAGQLAQIRQSSLARILCDNGDHIRRVPANVFLNTNTSHFLDCHQVKKVSLNPWTGQLISRSTLRRLTSLHRL